MKTNDSLYLNRAIIDQAGAMADRHKVLRSKYENFLAGIDAELKRSGSVLRNAGVLFTNEQVPMLVWCDVSVRLRFKADAEVQDGFIVFEQRLTETTWGTALEIRFSRHGVIDDIRWDGIGCDIEELFTVAVVVIYALTEIQKRAL